MSKIVTLDTSYDLWLTYSWSNNNHGVCGHTFEVIDYYYILRQHYKVGILLCEDIDWPSFEKTIRSKYNFSDEEINDIQHNTLFHKRPTLLKGTNILFVDGGIVNTERCTLLFDNILYFACGNKQIKLNKNPRVWVLQDDRVYDPVLVNGINYKKRILFEKLLPYTTAEDNALVYATKNCRSLPRFEDLKKYDKPLIVITDEKHTNAPGITFMEPPIERLFGMFSTYIYTPVQRKWDCSPRFLAECKFYKKTVVFHDIDYWDEDKGLFWRQWDIDHDFDSLFLTRDDELIAILKGII